MHPHSHVFGLAALLALGGLAHAEPREVEATGTVELAPGYDHQPDLVKVRLRTADGTLYSIGADRIKEPGFYANFVGRTITVRGLLHPAPQADWSDGLASIRTATREGHDGAFVERAPIVSPALTVFEGVVQGAALRTSSGELGLVGPLADLVLGAEGRKVAIKGYPFPAAAPTELFVVAVQGQVTSAARYRDVQGKKQLKLALRGRSVWVQGTAASGAPADPHENIPVRPADPQASGQAGTLLLVDKALMTEWSGPGLESACVLPVIKLWWSKTTFRVYVGTYLPSSAIQIGEAADVKGLSSLGQ